MKTRIDTLFKDDTRNKYALFCVQPTFDIICLELNKMESIKHNVELDDLKVLRCSPDLLNNFENMSRSTTAYNNGSAVAQCLTRDREAPGSSLTGVTVLRSLSKTHLS